MEETAIIEYTSGNILNDESEAIVNTVNCVGIMGRGIALQFKRAWPENFKAYKAACERKEVQPGRMFVFGTRRLTPPHFIINFPTKRHWRGKSRIEDVELGLAALAEVIQAYSIRSIALPPLGCGLGGLDWKDVRARIERALANLPGVRVRLYEPKGAPAADSMRHLHDVPSMTAGRAALVGLMRRYLGGLLDPSISLLEVHKLMYFMQKAGEPLRLKYVKAPYGPYAENLRHVLHAVEGHLLSGYADGGDIPDKPLTLVPRAMEDAERFLNRNKTTRERLDRVSALVEGFESPFGMELLSTVHWVVDDERPASVSEAVDRIYKWNPRKRQFTHRQIDIAIDVLTCKEWIPRLSDGASA